MIYFILEYKWLFFIFGEIIFWGSIIGFLLLRYGLGLDKLSKYLIIIWLLSDLWLLALGVLDYIESGTIDAFQIVIVVVLIYAFTAGKSDLQKLDRMIKRKFEKREEPPLNDEINSHNKTVDVFKNRKKEIKRLGLHLIIYLVMGKFMLLYGFKPLELSTENNVVDKIVYLIGNGFFNNELASKISGIWTLVILVDSLYSLPRFVFFKKN
ncbi:hypothetical protein KQI49_08765 [Virgibacillus sp. MSJ-26]|uniref:hypothetical protein n=1 Tax=Virgibacillus sp. MSJ-26 TaxID=2841522 RepID=UPI001C12758B|nr:hypothetical protein [Virgibacillus sp. MSJ-26]MBU5466919.1 hypothetical protein [Virgibacillus sp. MSJ-26]